MKKLIGILIMVMALTICTISYADIFGPRTEKRCNRSPSDSSMFLNDAADIVDYLGLKEGIVYDFNHNELCNQLSVTLYTYTPLKISLDVNIINTDGIAASIGWNIGDYLPCDNIPIIKYFKHFYISGGVGTRYMDDDDWELAPIVSGQFKFNF